MSAKPIRTDKSGCRTMENVTRRQVELIHKSIVSGGCDRRVILFLFISSGKNYNTCRDCGGIKFKREKKGRARLYSARHHFFYSLFRSTAIALTISQS
ncbi:hypothetical protein DAPPUDRAFT_304836 [Daphnia pulex]|uniref:Uncharacterized protein n=1 Tax=Daphnia pulex TaxID=6669 RepID=E9GMD9_DAPPU|nr:hypothetical protein DAPPUDRAFT_304836 [Daphnia pulex]|eukprot:EFX79349.1 hypothetical protein DAPPUDRAFT_304836 [Daphnia pulex]